jgi:hypothetical protein
MSDNDSKPIDEGVGYCRPPKSGQFKKGQSGNPNGRPKKADPSIVDLDRLLQSEVQVAGQPMDTREAELWRVVESAIKPGGTLRAIKYLIAEFEKYGAMKPGKRERRQLELPSTMDIPWAVQHILLTEKHLPPPWSKAQLRKAKAEYVERRNEGDRIQDRIMGYEEWLMS